MGLSNSLGIVRIYKYGRVITFLEIRTDSGSYRQAWHDTNNIRLENGIKTKITAVWKCNSGGDNNYDYFYLELNNVRGTVLKGKDICSDFLPTSSNMVDTKL